MDRELIILIPGLVRVSRSAQLSVFVEGLKAASERMPLDEIVDDTVPHGARRLRGMRGGNEVEIDIQEAYWNDLVPSLTQEPLLTKVLRGLSLFWYWTLSPVWMGFLSRKYLTFGLALSATAFIAWYLSTLVLFIEAVVNNPPDVLKEVIPYLENTMSYISGWRFWIFTSAIVGFLPVALLVDISDFAKRYVANESAASGHPAVRLEIIKQVHEQVLSALENADYTSLTVVGHSFGSVVAVDLFADLPSQNLSLRIVTMGSPIELLGKRATWLKDDVLALVERPDLVEWVDVNSSSDWFASGAGAPESTKFRAVPIKSFGTFLDKLAAKVHTKYFENQGAVNEVLCTIR
jgi:hypothetical protein